MSRSPHLPAKILSLYRGLNWVRSCTQSRWSQQHLTLSRLLPWNSSHFGNGEWNVHSIDRGGDEKHPIAKVQLMGQLVVVSSPCSPPALRSAWRLVHADTPPSSTACPEWSARAFISMEVACFWRYMTVLEADTTAIVYEHAGENTD